MTICLRPAAVVPALFTPLLAHGISAVEGFVFIGSIAGYVLGFFLGLRSASKRDAEKSATDAHTLSKNVTFTVLKNRRRRESLRYLRRTEGAASLSDLAEHIAAKENDVERHQLTAAQRKRVYTALYQCHLPMMDDADIVEYDRRRGSVELLDAAVELFKYIDDSRIERRTETNARS